MAANTQDSLFSSSQEQALRVRSTQTKFKQQLFLGMGSALVFGLISALGGKLFAMASVGEGLALAPILGIAGIAVLGLGLLYLGSRFMAEAISFDQDTQARKIELARGKSPEISQTIAAPEQGQPHAMGLPFETAAYNAGMPATAISDGVLQGRIADRQLAESRA